MQPLRCLPYACSAGSSKSGHEEAPHVFFSFAHEHCPTVEWDDGFREARRHASPLPLASAERLSEVARSCRTLAANVAAACERGYIPVTIGGDHSLSIGSIAGFAEAHHAYGDIGLLWVDAHLDSNTPETSPSQALHGMPLATLLGYGHSELLAIGSQQRKLDPRHVCLLGGRAMDTAELEFLNDQGVTIIPMEAIRHMGLPQACEKAWRVIGGARWRYLSFDIDSIDPRDAPGVGIPEAEGIGADAFLACLDTMLADGGFAGYDIAEYHPASDKDFQTAALMLNILSRIERS